MPTEPSFDETIHAPIRLRVCGLLRPVEALDFAVIRDALEISDAALSKHLKVLTEAGYVRMSKAASFARTDARRTATVLLTPQGRLAFDGHLGALRAIAGELTP